jgi:hypothetical protein
VDSCSVRRHRGSDLACCRLRPVAPARYQDVWAISADPMPAPLARGGRRATSWAVRFGLGGLALFALSAVLLMQAGRPPG